MRVVTMAGGFAVLAALLGTARAQDLTPEMRGKIDGAIQQVMEKTGVPSASVGIVQHGRIVFSQAYGDARLKPELKANAAMSYPVGSISKQFTSACVLLLAEDGKLKLDDPVSRWFPRLTRANEVTVRELLSHTSGYEDYAPQDYTIPAWTKPTAPIRTVEEWAGKPLDFDPGTQWQYSNTNFVLAALIVEKAGGMPFMEFLRSRVLVSAGLTHVLDLDTGRAGVEPEGYERRALAPLRPATLEAPGWYFGDGALAMPVNDLLTWDISIMRRSVLKAASYDTLEQEVRLKDGKGTGYGLGVSVGVRDGRRVVSHSGEVGGFVAQNTVWPDDQAAVAVLTNQEASGAASAIARGIYPLLFGQTRDVKANPAAETQIRTIVKGLQEGKIDRAAFTPDANFYFSPETLDDFATSLKPLGAVKSVVLKDETLRGGMTYRGFDVKFGGGRVVTVSTYTMADGRLEQLLVEGKS